MSLKEESTMDSITTTIQARSQSVLMHNRSTASLARIPRDIRLRDGSELRLRELRPADSDLLKAFFERCSPESIHSRFLSSIRWFSEGLLAYLVNGDSRQHVALVLTQVDGDHEKIVAEGRYVVQKDRPGCVDVAFLVSEEMRRRGIATLLIRELIQIGCRNGVTYASVDVLYDNWEMVSLIRKMFHTRLGKISNGLIHFEIPIGCSEYLKAAS
jgi:GNAT superfamily N-acetyltransferase